MGDLSVSKFFQKSEPPLATPWKVIGNSVLGGERGVLKAKNFIKRKCETKLEFPGAWEVSVYYVEGYFLEQHFY